MLTDRLDIDSYDAYEEFGFFVKEGGINSIFQLPTYKAIEVCDWHEQDGMDADLSNPVLNNRTIKISGYCNPASTKAFIGYLTSSSYHTFSFVEYDYSLYLRLVSVENYDTNAQFDTLTLTLADDYYQPPSLVESSIVTNLQTAKCPSDGYTIDGYDLNRCCCRVLNGTKKSYVKPANPKQALTFSNKTSHSVVYDSGYTIKRASRDITINLLIKCSENFQLNWFSLSAILFHVDTTKGVDGAKRTIVYGNRVVECFYKSNVIKRFLKTLDGSIWCEFTLSFTILKEYDTVQS